MSYIQLPDGLKQKVNKIKLPLPKNEKIKDLFGKLPYIANLRDPVLQNKLEDVLKNRQDLQNYLLATDDLKNTMEESLNLAVGYGKLNDDTAVRHVSERDSPIYNFFKRNDNPLDVVYKKNAKFDIQNPIIGSLLKQINKSRVTEQDIKSALDRAPNPKDVELEERYRKIFKGDDVNGRRPPSPNYIDRVFGSSLPPQTPPTPPPSPPPPSPPPFYPGDGGNKNYPFDNFPPPYFPFTARFPKQNGYNDDDNKNLEYDTYGNNFFRPVQRDAITLDENLQDIFPDVERVFQADRQEARENVKFENFSTKLENGKIPGELEFFQGERNENFSQNLNSLGLSHENEQFVDYLTSEECKDVLERDNI